MPPAVTYTVPLSSTTDFSRIGHRPEVQELLDAARRHPDSRIYLAAYVRASDAPADGSARQEAERVVVGMADYLAGNGIDPRRIRGKGMGVNASVGRAVVVSLDVVGRRLGVEPSPRRRLEHAAASTDPVRFPTENRTFKDSAGEPAYRVGEGDTLKITFWMVQTTRDFTVPVTSAGTITFDLLDDVYVAGLTPLEIEERLTTELAEYYRNPRLSVAVASFGARQVTVVGPAGARTLELHGRTTILDLFTRSEVAALSRDLQTTGGQTIGQINTAFGLPDLSRLRVVRGRESHDVNLYEVFIEGRWEQNFVLDDGDVVYIPTLTESRSYVAVLGAVNFPGVYPIRTRMSAVEALYAAGGPSGGAYLPHTRIIRGDREAPQLVAADIDRVLMKGDLRAHKELQAGDVLYVPATRISNWNAFLGDISPTLEILTLPTRIAFFLDAFDVLNIGDSDDGGTTNNTTIIVNPTPRPGILPLP